MQQLPMPFMLDVDSFEAVLLAWELYGNFSIMLDLPPADNEPTTYEVCAFFDVRSDGTSISLGIVSTWTGEALKTIIYPVDGLAHAYIAKIKPVYQEEKLPQGVTSNPIQLSVSKGTRLLLNVDRDFSSSKHVIRGWVMWGSYGVAGKTVRVAVNGTEYFLLTDGNGYFNLVNVDLKPVDNKPTTYMITASFEDDAQPINATAWAYMLDGTRYASCTTIQYGYKPSLNSTVLTVEPQATHAITTTKTPEQMKAEAEQSGWLSIWHEWSCWYPWYRIHFVFKYGGIEMYDQGISPLSLVGATLVCSDMFLNIIKDLWSLALWPVAVAVAGAEFAALLASNAGPWGFIAALLVSVGTKGLSLIANWNSIGGLAGALIGNVFSTVMGMLKWTWSFVADFLKLLMSIIDLAEFGLGNLYRIFSFAASIAYMGTIMGRLHELGAIP